MNIDYSLHTLLNNQSLRPYGHTYNDPSLVVKVTQDHCKPFVHLPKGVTHRNPNVVESNIGSSGSRRVRCFDCFRFYTFTTRDKNNGKAFLDMEMGHRSTRLGRSTSRTYLGFTTDSEIIGEGSIRYPSNITFSTCLAAGMWGIRTSLSHLQPNGLHP
jgi:hypothetical protein